MRDEIDGRLWAEHGPALAENLVQLLRSVGSAWERLQAGKFNAPWRDCSISGFN